MLGFQITRYLLVWVFFVYRLHAQGVGIWFDYLDSCIGLDNEVFDDVADMAAAAWTREDRNQLLIFNTLWGPPPPTPSVYTDAVLGEL